MEDPDKPISIWKREARLLPPKPTGPLPPGARRRPLGHEERVLLAIPAAVAAISATILAQMYGVLWLPIMAALAIWPLVCLVRWFAYLFKPQSVRRVEKDGGMLFWEMLLALFILGVALVVFGGS